jgi:anti-anti-sigma factor
MTITLDGLTAVVHVADEISNWNATDEIDEQVALALDAGAPEVVIDVSNVTYADSLGVFALVRAQQRCQDHGVDMSVRNPGGLLLALINGSARASSIALVA